MPDWIDEIESQADDTSPYYLRRLVAEIRRLRAELAIAIALLGLGDDEADPDVDDRRPS